MKRHAARTLAEQMDDPVAEAAEMIRSYWARWQATGQRIEVLDAELARQERRVAELADRLASLRSQISQ